MAADRIAPKNVRLEFANGNLESASVCINAGKINGGLLGEEI